MADLGTSRTKVNSQMPVTYEVYISSERLPKPEHRLRISGNSTSPGYIVNVGQKTVDNELAQNSTFLFSEK